jgi:hypothetical protein
MPGAVSYDVHVTYPSNGAGSPDFNNMDTTAFTPTGMSGTGVFTWSVRAEYPTAGGNVFSSYSAPQTFTRTIQSPQNPSSIVSGSHQVVVSWSPKATARTYTLQFSTDSGFGNSVFDSVQDTENTSWAPPLTAPAYAEGGTIYWRVAAKDQDNNTGAWSPVQTITMPLLIHLTAAGSPARNKTTSVKVVAKTGAGRPISGVTIAAAGAGIKAASLKTNASGAATFKVKATKAGFITFTATKAGAIKGTIKVSVF